ncbi:MAG: NHL repeat-containing protein [Thaumarchaeota archaeon]|nr:NHL repeat-containing protein [Nitrososphaerota archaeon]
MYSSRRCLSPKIATLISLTVVAIFLISGLLALPTARAFTNGQSAVTAIGQTNLTSSTSGLTQSTLSDPQGMVFDSSGNLWVADSGNNRVLEFQAPLSTGESASIVLGEANFTESSIDCAYSSVITASCLSTPEGLAFDKSGDLWVVDSGSYRILEFTPPFTNDENASLVIGQPNLTTGGNSGGTPTASNLNLPNGIGFDGSGNLWVADTLDNRVLEFTAPFSDGEAASVVLGQDNFTSGVFANYSSGCQLGQECPTASSLTTPDGVKFDSSGNLWTAERGTGRILEFKAPFTNGESSSLVLGQASFTTWGDAGGFYCSAVTPAQYCVSPDSLTFDKSGSMWVADTDNWRVVSFNQPFTNYENESVVLGLPNFTATPPNSGQQNANASNMAIPEAVAIDSAGNVWVSDSGQNRVVEFLASSTIATSSTTGTSTSSSTPATTTSSTTAASSATTAQTSTSSTSGGGGVPEFPYQLAIASVFTVLLAVCYLLVRGRTTFKGRASRESAGF